MKTMRAKRTVLFNMMFTAFPAVIFGSWIVYCFWKGRVGYGLIYVAIFSFYLFIGIHSAVRIYRTHWIKYGNGKVIIKRVSKELFNNKPTGRWQNREDEISLDEIKSYGLSRTVLGYNIEYDRRGIVPSVQECFFQLKDGRWLGFEMGHFTEQEREELFCYIYERKGIKFQDTNPKLKPLNKGPLEEADKTVYL